MFLSFIAIVIVAIEILIIEVRLKKRLENDERIINRLDLILQDLRDLKQDKLH